MTTPRTPDAPIHPLLLDRWSPRAFSGAPLSEAQLASLFEAIRWAPSCLNEQPWLVVYGTGGDADHAKILDLLVDANRVWAQRAPLLLILFARRVFARNDRPNRHHGFDAGRLLFQQRRQLGALVATQGAPLRHHMPVIGHYCLNVRHRRRQAIGQALQAKGRKGGVALEAKNVGHGEGISG